MQRSPRILPRLEELAGQATDLGWEIWQWGQIAWRHPSDLADEAGVTFRTLSYIEDQSSARHFTFRF